MKWFTRKEISVNNSVCEHIELSALLPCPYNRKVDKKVVERIMRAIRETGDIKPLMVARVLTDSGYRFMLTDGHHRYLAIKKLVVRRELPKTVRVPFVVAQESPVDSRFPILRNAQAMPIPPPVKDPKPPYSRAMNSVPAKEIALKPIEDKDSYSEYMTKVISWEFYEFIYAPFLKILKPSILVAQNSKYDLKRALLSGRVQYVDGFLFGKFNASVSAAITGLGGKFNSQRKAFKINISALPQDIRAAIAEGHTRNEEIKAKLKEQMDVLERSTFTEPRAMRVDFSQHLGKVMLDLEKQFRSSAAPHVEFLPEITETMKRNISEKYTRNLDLYIKDWEGEAVVRLRDKMNENFLTGFRSDAMVDTIMGEYGVSHRKAKFLARQETSLLAAQFREERYADIGVQKYRWSTSHDERVRVAHRNLSGKVFLFTNPPVTDPDSGARNNPGQDYNCRCKPVPLLSNRHAVSK